MFSKVNEAVMRLFSQLQSEKGQTLSEYGLILALIAVACVVALGVLALAISGILEDVGNTLNGAI